jgi:hypothetical protein
LNQVRDCPGEQTMKKFDSTERIKYSATISCIRLKRNTFNGI